MPNSLMLTLKELQDLSKRAEELEIVKDELAGNAQGNPDFVTLHIVRIPDSQNTEASLLSIKVIH